MKQIGVWLFFVMLASSPAYADMVLTAKHTLVSVQPDGAGSILTFNIAISNAGTSSLNYANLVAKDPLVPPDASTNTQHIGALAAGDTVTLNWSVPSALPPDQLAPGTDIPFNIDVEAADESGTIVTFPLTSKGGEL